MAPRKPALTTQISYLCCEGGFSIARMFFPILKEVTVSALQAFLRDVSAEHYWSDGELHVSTICKSGEQIVFDDEQPCVTQLISDLTRMTAQSFGSSLNEASDEGTRQHIEGVDGLAILHNKQEVFGFASGLFPREGLFYLHGVAISPVAKGYGRARILLQSLKEGSRLGAIAFTTQNPLMFCLLRSMYREVYPNPEGGLPISWREQANRLMTGRTGEFNPETGVAKNLYSKCLYDSVPFSRDETVNAWFSNLLNIQCGQTRDGFLFLGSEPHG